MRYVVEELIKIVGSMKCVIEHEFEKKAEF